MIRNLDLTPTCNQTHLCATSLMPSTKRRKTCASGTHGGHLWTVKRHLNKELFTLRLSEHFLVGKSNNYYETENLQKLKIVM